MLTCPFCQFDYSDHGLREGRCPSCGSVVSWEGNDDRVSKEVEAAILAQTMHLLGHGPSVPLMGASGAPNSPPLVTPGVAAKPDEPSSATHVDGNDLASNTEPSSSPVASTELGHPGAPATDGALGASDAVGDSQRELNRTRRLAEPTWLEMSAADESRASSGAGTDPDLRPSPKSRTKSETKTHSSFAGRRTQRVGDTQFVIPPRALSKSSQDSERIEGAEYELLNKIGEGGVGVVYKARQSSVDREVAIKMLRAGRAENELEREKFLAEAVVTGDLEHPNIVPIHDLGTDDDGALFYSMKRVKGTPWSSEIQRKSVEENLDILLRVSDAIAFAHDRGVVHRDLKPENVMLGDYGEVLVMDWGIALPLPSYPKAATILRSQGLGGTPSYMAPELVTGPLESITPAADVYLLGAILFEMLTGVPPHTGRSIRECVEAAKNNVIVTTTKTGELMDIARRALATNPADRYASVPAFQAAIREYRAHAESILLSDRAADDLKQAAVSESYEDYARAVFGFGEAAAMWDGNRSARIGLVRAKQEYAQCALQKGDYDLGLSLLDESLPEHRILSDKLHSALDERNARQARLRRVRRMVVLLMTLVFVGGAATLVLFYRLWDKAEKAKADAVIAEGDARKAQEETEEKRLLAKAAEERANKSKEDALGSAAVATLERGKAEREKLKAEEARQDVEEASYFAEINVVAAKIRENFFEVARETLMAHRDGDSSQRESGARKYRYRHWEWGRQWFLCRGDEAALRNAQPDELRGFAHRGDERERLAVRTYATKSPVEAIALSGDERWVAVGGKGGTIEIWSFAPSNTTSGKRLAQVEHPEGVGALKFSPDGKRLAVAGGSKQGTVLLWDVLDDGQLRAVVFGDEGPPKHGRAVRDIAFSPVANNTLLTAGEDATLQRWQVEERDGKVRSVLARTYRGHLAAIWCAAFSPDGTVIVSGGEDRTVRAWHTEDGRMLERFDGHQGTVYGVAFAPDGKWFVSAGSDRRILLRQMPEKLERRGNANDDGVAKIIDSLENRSAPPNYFTLLGHADTVRTIAVSDSGKRLITAGQDNTAMVWNLPAAIRAAEQALGGDGSIAPSMGAFLDRTLRGHGTWIKSCAVSRNGGWVVTGSSDETWRRWDVDAYQEAILLHDADATAVLSAKYLPDGKGIVTAMADGTVRHWNVQTGVELGRFSEGHDFLTTAGVFFPDRTRVATAAGDETVRVWNVATGNEELRLKGAGRRGLVAISADGSRLLTDGEHKTAKWWDARTGELLLTIDPNATRLEQFISVGALEQVAQFRRTLPEVTSLAIAPAADSVWLGTAKGDVSRWDLTLRESVAFPSAHQRAVLALYDISQYAWAKKAGVAVLSVGEDGQVIAWSRDGQQPVGIQVPTKGALDACALSDDGTMLACAAATSNQVVRLSLWSLVDRRELGQTELRGESVNALSFRGGKSDEVLVATTNARRRPDLKIFAPSREPILSSYSILGDEAPTAWGALWAAIPSVDNKQLLTVGGRAARIWDLERKQLQATFQPHGAIQALDVSPDGQLLATGGAEGTIRLWNIAEHRSVRTLTGQHRLGQAIRSVQFSPDGKRLLTAGFDGAVFLWDVASGAVVSAGKEQDRSLYRDPATPVLSAQFSPDGGHVLLVVAGGRPSLWNLLHDLDATTWTMKLERALVTADPTHAEQGNVLAAAFSPDGRWLIFGGDDSYAELWSVAEGKLIYSLPVRSESVISVAFSADGHRVLTGTDDGQAMLWDTRCLARSRVTSGAVGRIVTAEKRLDNTTVAGQPAVDVDHSDRPREILTLSRYVVGEKSAEAANERELTHDDSVTTVMFAPSGRDLLTASRDGLTIIWPGSRMPPAIDLSSGRTDVRGATNPQSLDPTALVSFAGERLAEKTTMVVTLSIAMEQMPTDTPPTWKLSVRDTVPVPLGRWRLNGDVIEYQSAVEGEPRVVGNVVGAGSVDKLTITLDAGTPAFLLESLIRGVSIAHDEKHHVNLLATFLLLNGDETKGNPETRPIMLKGSASLETVIKGPIRALSAASQ